jgi:hypothetical protein
MLANEPVARAIDEAFEDHMKGLFTSLARHLEGGHNDVGRAEFRKKLAVALQTRSEMLAIANEGENG